MFEGITTIVEALRDRAMAAWNLTAEQVFIGEDRAEKSGSATRYAAIVWEEIQQDPYAGFIEFTCRPIYVVYVGPPPPGTKGEAAKTELSRGFQSAFVQPANIVLECVNTRYDEDWDEAKARTVSLVLEYSALWHECRTQRRELAGTGSAVSGGSAA